MKHVIIGAGAAGITAAKTIRACEPEAEIVMISADTCVHSRCMLHKYLSHERDERRLSFVPEDFFEEQKITWISGKRAAHVWTKTRNVQLEDDTVISYDRLLIATGADSFIPPVGDFRKAGNVFGLRHLEDAKQIDKAAETAERVLIVGSGLVGLDAAYALLERGKDVTVVEMADRILPIQLDETAGKTYQKLFEEAGCKFLLGRKASETVMDQTGAIKKVILDDGREISCDLVIVAAGVRSAISCVESGEVAADRFIKVDEYMRTSCPDVYAAGDVAGLSGIWPNAMKQGQTAAYNMCGRKVPYLDRYAMKNTMNFYGVTTLSLGKGVAEEGDEVLICEDSHSYKKAVIRDGKLDSILLQGNMDYSGVYQYLIKNQVDISEKKDRIFALSFGDFYGIAPDGQYDYQI
ncbi:NAD(P)/FAD-dependent oxidoreductase [Qiania dongpingensis]|uniref:NAD(P)/FAD-dependent oxidoreductase n=1 Tax=Qiania dongpingensis TaxID=2763669 RepID=A0A7G9G5Q6_9FIRM|nr:FAD-dependent oxidoreductase [Qiania dongpingensis]QNM06138.1 NAD(P)/FAD-dependent oxidoreductase [Qiania dongpingensis]